MRKESEAATLTGLPIGRAFARSRGRAAIAIAVGVAIVACDLWLAGRLPDDRRRLIFAVIAVLVYGFLVRFDRVSLGFRLRPQQRWRYWLKVAGILGAAVGVFCFAAWGAFALVGRRLPEYRLFSHPSEFWSWVWHACFVAPLLEELLYRFTLCTPSAAVLGKWPTVVLSGCVFGGLHFVYGNPSPDNFIAGFILGWAYLKSGTLIVPVALHGLGNLAVGLIQVAACYAHL